MFVGIDVSKDTSTSTSNHRVRFRRRVRAAYERLRARGTPPRAALVAVMRKLLTILNAVVRDARPWQAA